MKIFTFLVAAAAVVTQAAAKWLEFRGSNITCYDRWSVNGNNPSIWEATTRFCNKYEGRNTHPEEEGSPPEEIVEFKTPEGHPFKLSLLFFSVSDENIWKSDLCIKLFKNVIQGCQIVKGHDVGHFMGGGAATPKWNVGIQCDNSSC